MKKTVAAVVTCFFFPPMLSGREGMTGKRALSDMRSPADTLRLRTSYTKWAIPAVCVTYGIVARFNETPVRRFDKYVANRVNENIRRQYPIDDYLQYAPVIAVFGLDFVPGIASRHNLRDRTLLLATSYLFMGAAVGAMKTGIPVWRPLGQANNSFPSGHTAMAFTGAHLLYREYRDVSPWIGIGGYAVATATGALRVVNQRHWVSDVVTGAGISILCVEAAYLMLPVWHRALGIHDGRGGGMALVPAVTPTSVGVGWVYVF
ncbi:MAG: phosphatase PAP2 family protein [Tannerella sp.]|nr:phosphatase PAP2 family protein [Tannerella sp.]